ncbi:MAG TPA: nucleotide exchange factor GrpE, partial [Solirubrobacteraceae bacterium]|nr:nucleotide exchange factor GrpE [Solirubrobacteraceae bacterium]
PPPDATQSASGAVEEAEVAEAEVEEGEVAEAGDATDAGAAGEREAEVAEAGQATDAGAAGEREAAEAGAGADHGAAAAAAERAGPDYHDQYLRAVAELDNVRKRARRDVAAAEARGIARLAKELLPALDDFDRALAAAESQPENQDHHLTDGIRLVQAQLLAALKRVGIEPDAPKGEKFDPHRHEALAQQPVDGAETGTIVEVYSPGYRYGEDVLRAAKVVVAA